jgi:tetratricopeptide (TPR) repeat protein
MKINKFAVALAMLIASSSLATAQSPGSIEWQLKYAREYLDAGKWDQAKSGYEAVLERDPTNAEAQAGYAKAKENSETKKAAEAAQAKAYDGQRGRSPTPAPGPQANRAGRSKPVDGRLTAKNVCDRTFNACFVTSKNQNPFCFAQRAMCYRRSGIK